MPDRHRERFERISSRAYEHPADRSALVALRRLSGFDTILKKLAGLISDRRVRLLYLANGVKVSEQQFPHIHDMVRDAAYVLDLDEVPPLYVTQEPEPNAMAVGMDEPVIVLTTGLIELMDEEELRAVVGHEVGHVLSGHAVYRTMLLILTRFATAIAWLPLGSLAIRGIIAALLEWFRKSELSCDRAGLLVEQDLDASMRGLMKLAGGAHLHEMSTDAFLAQAAEYEAAGDLRDSVLKLLNLWPQTHPFTSIRAAELKKWVDSGDYQRILDGDYPRRDDDRNTSFRKEASAGAKSYADGIKQTKDPLFGLIRDVAGGTADLGGKLRDQFFGGGGSGGGSGSDRGGDGGSSGRS